MPAGKYENQERPYSRQLVSGPKSEPGTSRNGTQLRRSLRWCSHCSTWTVPCLQSLTIQTGIPSLFCRYAARRSWMHSYGYVGQVEVIAEMFLRISREISP
jgi:hypothetical protein